MKKFISSFIIFAIAVFLCIPATADETFVKISDSVFAYSDVKNASPANSFGANVGLIVGSNGLVVVDTLSSAKDARKMIDQIRKITDKPIRYVIDTHSHFDHVMGNSEFEKQGATIISHESCREAMVQFGDNATKVLKAMGYSDEMLDGTTVAYPSLTFQKGMKIDLGNVTVELTYLFPSHSPGSILVSVPGEKVLFTGDILFTDFHPYIGAGDIDGWQKNLDYIMAFDTEKIIPGHGPLSGKQDLAAMEEYLTIFDEKAKELCAASDNLDEIAAQMQEVLPSKTQAAFLIRASLQAKYFKPGK